MTTAVFIHSFHSVKKIFENYASSIFFNRLPIGRKRSSSEKLFRAFDFYPRPALFNPNVKTVKNEKNVLSLALCNI